MSSGDSAVHFPPRKPMIRLTHKEKGKKKVSDFGMDRRESDQRESDSEDSGDGSSRVKSTSAAKASTSANEQLHRFTQKNPVIWFGYIEYMAHHYAYISRVA